MAFCNNCAYELFSHNQKLSFLLMDLSYKSVHGRNKGLFYKFFLCFCLIVFIFDMSHSLVREGQGYRCYQHDMMMTFFGPHCVNDFIIIHILLQLFADGF